MGWRRSAAPLPSRSAIQAELAREWIECSLGGITLNLPRPFLLEELGVVAKCGDAAHEREHRVLACRLSVFLDLAVGRIAVAGNLICGLGGDGRHHHHFHQSKRPGLVRADPRYRSERLDRRKTSNYRLALSHALDTDG